MPFIAIWKATGERIDITTIENPRAALTSGECLCQLCGAPMIVKAGLVRQHHFAHRGQCTSDYQSHPESPAHQDAKRYLATHLREWFKEYANTTIEYEVPIREVKRVADLLVTFPTGWRVVHEVQLASTTTEELQRRTNDYTLAGIDVVWWLGKSADTPANREWCQGTFGHCLRVTPGSPSPGTANRRGSESLPSTPKGRGRQKFDRTAFPRSGSVAPFSSGGRTPHRYPTTRFSVRSSELMP